MAGDRSASNHLQRSRGLSALTLGAIALVLSAGACSGTPAEIETASVTASSAVETSSEAGSEAEADTGSIPSTSVAAPTSSALSDSGEQLSTADESAASAEDSEATSTSVASSEPATAPTDSPATTTDTSPPTTEAAPLQVVESKEYGFAQVLPRGFEPVELDEEDADGAAVFVNTETNTVIRVYGAPKTQAVRTTATTRPVAVATTDGSTTTTAAPAAGSTTTVTATGTAAGSTTTIATTDQQTTSTAATSATTDTSAPTTTEPSTAQSSTVTTALVPIYNDDNSNIAATDFATQQVSAPIEGDGDNVIVTSTVDVGTHIVVIEVEGPPETVEETLEETSNGLVLRDPDPSEVRLSDSISLAIPGGFSATGSSNGWLQYTSSDQTMTIIGGVGGSGNASRSGTLAMIDQYGDETGATASYSIWSAVEADGRAIGEIVVSAPGSSFSISVDGPTTSGVNNRLSAVRKRLIVTDLAAS